MFIESDHGIQWSSGFVYDGQLLRLAVDLAQRLLPAFYTETGLPYPRVNLRHGIPFYENSPLNTNVRSTEGKRKSKDAETEPAETCSAGAGSLVLELTVLSRLTGDGRYEDLGKRAFWAVWNRRSDIGLLGFGIDVESGKWVGPWAGVSRLLFYRYKHILIVSRLARALTVSTSMPSKLMFSCPRASACLSTPTVLGHHWTHTMLLCRTTSIPLRPSDKSGKNRILRSIATYSEVRVINIPTLL